MRVTIEFLLAQRIPPRRYFRGKTTVASNEITSFQRMRCLIYNFDYSARYVYPYWLHVRTRTYIHTNTLEETADGPRYSTLFTRGSQNFMKSYVYVCVCVCRFKYDLEGSPSTHMYMYSMRY